MAEEYDSGIRSALVESDDHIGRASWMLRATAGDDKAPDELSQVDRAAMASAHAQLAQAHALYGLLRSQAQLLDELHTQSHSLRYLAANLPGGS